MWAWLNSIQRSARWPGLLRADKLKGHKTIDEFKAGLRSRRREAGGRPGKAAVAAAAAWSGLSAARPRGRTKLVTETTIACKGSALPNYAGPCGASTPPCGLRQRRNSRPSPSTRPATFGGTVEVKWEPGYPAMVNHETETEFAVEAAKRVSATVEPNTPAIMGGEDFAYMLEVCPGRLYPGRQRRHRRRPPSAVQFQRRGDPGRRILLGRTRRNAAIRLVSAKARAKAAAPAPRPNQNAARRDCGRTKAAPSRADPAAQAARLCEASAGSSAGSGYFPVIATSTSIVKGP